jgi:hypothetical protein
MDSRRLASELGLSGSEHLHACGTGPLALGERTAVGTLCLGPSGLWAAASMLAPRASSGRQCRGSLGNRCWLCSFSGCRRRWPNTDQVLVGHLSTPNVAICPFRGMAYPPSIISPGQLRGRTATLCSLGPAAASFPVRGSWRTARVMPLVPGVQWAAPLPGPGSLDASWHAQQPTTLTKFHRLSMLRAQLDSSGDSALQRRLLAQLPTWATQLWRERRQAQHEP